MSDTAESGNHVYEELTNMRAGKSSKGLNITERPIPLYGWKPEHGPDRLMGIEQDTRMLMRNLAEAKFLLDEGEKHQLGENQLLLLSLLEVTDAFDRVFQNVESKKEKIDQQMKIWIGNFRTVARMLRKILTEQGVKEIENLGQGFDPHWHKIAETVVDTSKSDGTIIEVVRKGYVWKNRILREAEVVVVRNVVKYDGESEGETDSPCTGNSDPLDGPKTETGGA